MCQRGTTLLDDRLDDGLDDPQTILEINCEDEDSECEDILCFLADPSAYENKVNMILYHYGQAIREAAEDEDLLCLMVDEMIADAEGFGVQIYGLALSEAEFKDTINYHLRQSIGGNNIYPKNGEPGITDSLALANWDANKYLRSKFKYDSDSYEPVIYFVKPPAECETEEEVGVYVGIEVSCCDQVPGWKNGAEILFSEDDHDNAWGAGELSIFVGVGDPNLSTGTIRVPDDFPTADISSRVADIQIDADRYQIKSGHRYEKNCKSDIKAATMKFFPNSQFSGSLAAWSGFSVFKIHKNDINNSVIFTDNRDAYDINETSFNNDQMSFIVIWEHDWPGPWKTFNNPCSEYGEHNFSARMTFSHEWYYIACDESNVWFPSVNSNEVFENSKCMFDLKRLQ
jgi:hypothetical protein